jgi:hypothetical protein
MTDRDVVQRAASLFGVAVQANDKGRFRTEYAATVKGSRAIRLMEDIRDLMGARRQIAIDAALVARRAPQRKLSYEICEAIRASLAEGDSVSAVARRFGVARSTIRPVRDGKIYVRPPPRPWRTDGIQVPGKALGMSAADLLWLAGWLEGEGSFLAPPPSDPRRPRVVAQSRDLDVVARAAQLVGVSPIPTSDARRRNRGWSLTYEVLKRGQGAVELMRALRPVMGARRQTQIDRALSPDSGQSLTNHPAVATL